ncbi:leucine-rich repeat protein 2-like isoform X2 [Apium graveolens]|uniref:leucine-rich repeat protein 2-like isoform X2 n=1 Tax=Apium graveolens TaxID=4045 RepID=UPI003D79B3D6
MATTFVLFIFLVSVPSILCNSEGNALHVLRTRLSDPNNVLQSWDPTLVNPCTWFHVTCNNENSVTRLELYRNNIDGKIPKELGKLKNLISLDLYNNKFEGRIPKSLAKLKSLRFLRLNDNNLSGPIPRKLAKLTNLKVFDVSNNNLCGTIPVDGPFANFPIKSFENNRLNGPELKGLVPYDFGC